MSYNYKVIVFLSPFSLYIYSVVMAMFYSWIILKLVCSSSGQVQIISIYINKRELTCVQLSNQNIKHHQGCSYCPLLGLADHWRVPALECHQWLHLSFSTLLFTIPFHLQVTISGPSRAREDDGEKEGGGMQETPDLNQLFGGNTWPPQAWQVFDSAFLSGNMHESFREDVKRAETKLPLGMVLLLPLPSFSQSSTGQ